MACFSAALRHKRLCFCTTRLIGDSVEVRKPEVLQANEDNSFCDVCRHAEIQHVCVKMQKDNQTHVLTNQCT